MSNIIIAIAGASGAGKSTAAITLVKKYPERIALLHVDDYFRKKEEVPLLHNMLNWDDPRALNFEKLLLDLHSLQDGQPVTVRTKSEFYHPDYAGNDTKIHVTISPKPVILLEGFMALWHPEVRKLLTASVFLDMSAEASLKRRKRFENSEYTTKILLPMIEEHVRPTRAFATSLMDVSTLDAQAVFERVEEVFSPWLTA